MKTVVSFEVGNLREQDLGTERLREVSRQRGSIKTIIRDVCEHNALRVDPTSATKADALARARKAGDEMSFSSCWPGLPRAKSWKASMVFHMPLASAR